MPRSIMDSLVDSLVNFPSVTNYFSQRLQLFLLSSNWN